MHLYPWHSGGSEWAGLFGEALIRQEVLRIPGEADAGRSRGFREYKHIIKRNIFGILLACFYIVYMVGTIH